MDDVGRTAMPSLSARRELEEGLETARQRFNAKAPGGEHGKELLAALETLESMEERLSEVCEHTQRTAQKHDGIDLQNSSTKGYVSCEVHITSILGKCPTSNH
jgi:hypothetical protein